MTPLPRRCRRVQDQLPRLIADEGSRRRERRVERHLETCEDCSAELARQVEVNRRLRMVAPIVEPTAMPADQDPPAWLLDSLLEQASDPGLRARAAAPARGAVSGARPGLSVAAVLLTAVVAGAVGYLSWRAGRRLAAYVETRRRR